MWRIGREAVAVDGSPRTPLDRLVAHSAGGSGGPIGDIADTVAKWIPGEVLALYGVGVSLIGSPSWFWLLVGVLLAPGVVVLAAFANSGIFPPNPTIAVRAGLGMTAMLVWTLTVPGSGWREWGLFRDNPAETALAGAAIGLTFGLVAEGVTRWTDRRPPRPGVPATGAPGPFDTGSAAPRPSEPGPASAGPFDETTTDVSRPPLAGGTLQLPTIPPLN